MVARRAVQQGGAEQQYVAGVSGHDPRPRMFWLPRGLVDPGAAMRARNNLRGAVFRPVGIEEDQRGNRLRQFGSRAVAMQQLRASARARFAPLDLRQEERHAKDVIRRGKQRRQAAHVPHRGIEIEQSVAPVQPTRDRPFVVRQGAVLERGAEWLDPARRDDAARQQKAVVVESLCVLGVEPVDLRVPRRFVHDFDFTRWCGSAACIATGAWPAA